ncbi:MAG TPA: hypothetical protein VGH99_03200 [Pseudonocardia sp.]|jgi:hypothetical protein
MGMFGKLFDGARPTDEGGEDSDGKVHRPRFDIDLDGGVVRMPTLGSPNAAPAPDATDERSDG